MRGWSKVVLCAGVALLAAGCPKGKPDYQQGRKAENLQDYDAAYDFYQKALKEQPENAEYQIKFNQARFEAGAFHIKQGVKLREQGNLQAAMGEFQRAAAIDPSSSMADQELRKTSDMLAEQDHKAAAAQAAADAAADAEQSTLASMPPEIKPLSRAPISLHMVNDAKIVFDTIGKLAGLTVVYDADFPARRIPVDLNGVTLQQALDIVSMESKAFWKPVTENIIFVIPDQPQKRRDYEEQIVKTFYLSNTVQAQDLTEIVTGLRQLLDLKRLQQLNAQNAIIIRDSPDKLAVAEKMINDIDKARPEVVIQVQVLEARLDKMRNLGILPGQTASIGVVPPGTTTTTTNNNNNNNNNGNGTSTTTNILTLQNLTHLNGSNYSVTLPSFTANALLNDSTTKIIQNPEVRSVDGQPAKLRIGDRVPVATGSFQAGVGVGSTAGSGFVNPLVNTQFQYIDVGVNVDITPRVHPNHEVSLKVSVEVSSVTGQTNIGGIQQPIISQRKIDHEIRLKEGEANILGGLVEKTDTKGRNGWPGFGSVPLLHYLFSEDTKSYEDDEILIILTPKIVRMPEWTKANLRPLYTGSEALVQVKRDSEVRSPQSETAAPAPAGVAANPGAAAPAANPAQGAQSGQMRFEPRNVTLKAGEKTTIGVVVDNVNDLFSIPFLLQYNPAVISVEEVQHGGFLQGGNQEIAIVQRVDPTRGQAIISATRQPNTAGVSGTGTIMGIVVKAIAPGNSNLSIVQVNAKDSQQKAIPLVTSEATVQVQP
ncbi:MAG: type II and III secretion system protein [Acidobacteria bacterium]|nr:type II and III secretion system protein [Acidobacteriota bacterium]